MLKKIKEYAQSNYSKGRVVVDKELCTGCTHCVNICPASALEMNYDRKSQMIKDADCISCGACTAVCGTTAITIESFYHVPDGVYQTQGRIQPANDQSFPRFFSENIPLGIVPKEKAS